MAGGAGAAGRPFLPLGGQGVNTYGWIPDLPDKRDFLYLAPPDVTGELPPRADLRAHCPAIYDQGQLGSCTAQAIAGAIEFDQMKEGLHAFIPSRLFIYYNERAREGTVEVDSGGMLRDGIKSVAAQGACPESEWPYDIACFADEPTERCYEDGLKHRAVEYRRLSRDLDQLRGCLASGYPFTFGFTVYESFETVEVARSGVAPLPEPGEAAVGGHAVLAVGYDDASARFVVRNSWGDRWGMAGCFTMPYEYAQTRGLSADFWTIRLVR